MLYPGEVTSYMAAVWHPLRAAVNSIGARPFILFQPS
jgi:hypothetical protein